MRNGNDDQGRIFDVARGTRHESKDGFDWPRKFNIQGGERGQ